jgi:hypothetical protein
MKSFLTSKVLWFNVITFILGGIGALGDISVITPEVLVFIVTIGNFLLRFVTTKAIK